MPVPGLRPRPRIPTPCCGASPGALHLVDGRRFATAGDNAQDELDGYRDEGQGHPRAASAARRIGSASSGIASAGWERDCDIDYRTGYCPLRGTKTKQTERKQQARSTHDRVTTSTVTPGLSAMPAVVPRTLPLLLSASNYHNSTRNDEEVVRTFKSGESSFFPCGRLRSGAGKLRWPMGGGILEVVREDPTGASARRPPMAPLHPLLLVSKLRQVRRRCYDLGTTLLHLSTPVAWCGINALRLHPAHSRTPCLPFPAA
uniref:Uncharacterized protein n=1 Tax=Mycena chlorophos TaxID=658473 RepID=A0ABQ0LKZ9_MYCCL|nr:predicted protein [Mycena chlorophos]